MAGNLAFRDRYLQREYTETRMRMVELELAQRDLCVRDVASILTCSTASAQNLMVKLVTAERATVLPNKNNGANVFTKIVSAPVPGYFGKMIHWLAQPGEGFTPPPEHVIPPQCNILQALFGRGPGLKKHVK